MTRPFAVCILVALVFMGRPSSAAGKDDAAACKSGCNQRCKGASNKAKCVGTCRRACDR